MRSTISAKPSPWSVRPTAPAPRPGRRRRRRRSTRSSRSSGFAPDPRPSASRITRVVVRKFSRLRARSAGTAMISGVRSRTLRLLLGAHLAQRLADDRPHGPPARVPRAAGCAGPRSAGVVLVLDDEVLLGREVAEERAGRDLRRGRDLVDRGRLVALLGEEAQRVLLDRPARLLLLALTQSGRGSCRRFFRIRRPDARPASRRTGREPAAASASQHRADSAIARADQQHQRPSPCT